MASVSELTVSIAVDHRIKGLFLVSMTFLKMAIQQIFTRKPKSKADLKFKIEINLIRDLKPFKPKRQYGALDAMATIPRDYNLCSKCQEPDIDKIAKELQELNKRQPMA
jgi:hypothetical protein